MNEHRRLQLPGTPPHLREDVAAGGAVAWPQPVSIRTYAVGEPDPYPMFVDRRVYQGSSGRVYPIPFIDRVDAEAAPREWQAIHLENRWIRVMVLPELGGRIHVGYDKVADYDFFYRNNVIKPALVGLAGPWISGGVEFNWPQHHRPATFLPVQTEIERGQDGSVTVWCSDHDPFARMKGMHGIRIHPDRAVIELVVRLHNRTSEAQTFLWWANVAARVHDDYQSFFPTDVHYVADHARRAITAFPQADRPYYGVDYPSRHTAGGDRIDFYRNIPVPTSYMVTATRDDFFGGYDHAVGAGFVHVADRHIAPGKKQWTWGNAPFGHAWDRHLTDDDGPYIELMAGVYTDNQPDFAWLEPGETKIFRQMWFPFRGIGPVHQANEEAAVRLDVEDGRIRVGLVVTRPRQNARVSVHVQRRTVHSTHADLEPGEPWSWSSPPGDVLEIEPGDVRVVVEHDGAVVLEWTPRTDESGPEPEVATAPALPGDVATIDELYLTGIHLAQYRHPTRSPLLYWEEAVRRDPGDARCNLALGDDAYRRGRYDDAESHVRAALRRLTARNANPRDGETSYVLGLVLRRAGRDRDAADAFAKAAWDSRWLAPASVELARIAARAGRPREALARADAALSAAPGDARARALRVVQLRRLGREAESEAALREALQADPLDQVARALDGGHAAASLDARTLIDVALDLHAAGDDSLALELLELAASAPPTLAGEARPMAWYHRAHILDKSNRPDEAAEARREARRAPDALCFPFGLDDHDALVAAVDADPSDDRARNLLAMLLFDSGRERDAFALWEVVVASAGADPVALRNCALAVYAVHRDGPRAKELYDRAIAARADARLLFERDQLLARMGTPAADRLRDLDRFRDVLLERDDVTVEYCDLLMAVGRGTEARSILETRSFAPWEGGEGRVLAAWERLHLALADERVEAGDLDGALRAVETAIDVPPRLGEHRHPLADTTLLYGRLADILQRLGRDEAAADARRNIRISTAVTPLAADGSVDYFATSLPEMLLFPPADADVGS